MQNCLKFSQVRGQSLNSSNFNLPISNNRVILAASRKSADAKYYLGHVLEQRSHFGNLKSLGVMAEDEYGESEVEDVENRWKRIESIAGRSLLDDEYDGSNKKKKYEEILFDYMNELVI